jgi:hypothetical protein
MSLDIEPRTNKARGRSPVPPAEAAADSGVVPATVPRLPGRRNPKWIALGIVAICLGGLLSFVIYSRVATEVAVVAVAQTVLRGDVIEKGDLTTVTLRRGSVARAIPATQLDQIVGQRAVFDLVEGSVIPTNAVGEVVIPPDGQAVVGLKLSGGRAPSTLLLPGAPIRLVALPSTESSKNDKLTGSVYVARVVDLSAAPDGTSSLVNVTVASAQAPVIAALAAQDRVAVVRDAGR